MSPRRSAATRARTARREPRPRVIGKRRMASGSAPRLAEAVDELIGLAADAGLDDALAVIVRGMAQQGALGLETEARAFDLLLHRRAFDAVEGGGDGGADALAGFMVDDEIGAAGLQRLEGGGIVDRGAVALP